MHIPANENLTSRKSIFSANAPSTMRPWVRASHHGLPPWTCLHHKAGLTCLDAHLISARCLSGWETVGDFPATGAMAIYLNNCPNESLSADSYFLMLTNENRTGALIKYKTPWRRGGWKMKGELPYEGIGVRKHHQVENILA